MSQTASTVTTSRKPRDPRGLAIWHVEQWFDSLLASKEVFTQGSVFQAFNMQEAFTEVKDALDREDCASINRGGEPKFDADSGDEDAFCEAGYLIGVQVGLRLRGGVR
jgi:hypothetical protein